MSAPWSRKVGAIGIQASVEDSKSEAGSGVRRMLRPWPWEFVCEQFGVAQKAATSSSSKTGRIISWRIVTGWTAANGEANWTDICSEGWVYAGLMMHGVGVLNGREILGE